MAGMFSKNQHEWKMFQYARPAAHAAVATNRGWPRSSRRGDSLDDRYRMASPSIHPEATGRRTLKAPNPEKLESGRSARHGDDAGAAQFHEAQLAHQANKVLDFVAATGDLEHE